MADKMVEVKGCRWCGGDIVIPDGLHPNHPFIRDTRIIRYCDKCWTKTYNVPLRKEDIEAFGAEVGDCEVCDCSLYEKDVAIGKCPSCSIPFKREGDSLVFEFEED